MGYFAGWRGPAPAAGRGAAMAAAKGGEGLASLAWLLGRHEHVLLYVPNLIGASPAPLPPAPFHTAPAGVPPARPSGSRSADAGGRGARGGAGYIRVLGLVFAVRNALHSPVTAGTCYALSFVCDELDGRFARKFSQCSSFGAVLDMVTDRVGTMILLTVLAVVSSDWALMCCTLQALDISSHWFQMYHSMLALEADRSHKTAALQKNPLVILYYRHRLFMGFLCVSCEVLYMTLYAKHWMELRHGTSSADGHGGEVWRFNFLPYLFVGTRYWRPGPLLYVANLALPGFFLKQLVNVLQLKQACEGIVAQDIMSLKHGSSGTSHGMASAR